MQVLLVELLIEFFILIKYFVFIDGKILIQICIGGYQYYAPIVRIHLLS